MRKLIAYLSDRSYGSDMAAIAAATWSVLFLLGMPQSARADDALAQYLGSWGGTGRVVFSGGKDETIKCAAYYTGGSDELRIAVRCASPAYTIKVRSKLTHDNGQLTGTWEEKNFNASGQATGHINDKQIMLAVTGGGFTGTMFVIHDGDTQTVNIATLGGNIDRVSIVLVKHKKDRTPPEFAPG